MSKAPTNKRVNKQRVLDELFSTLSDYFVDQDWEFDGHRVLQTVSFVKKGKGLLRVGLTEGVEINLKATVKQARRTK